jgi:hypothetical protein
MWQDAKSSTGFGSSGCIGKVKWVMVISLHSSLKESKGSLREHLGAVCALVFPLLQLLKNVGDLKETCYECMPFEPLYCRTF